MAPGITNEALRKQALADLQQGRQEITAEMARLRTELSPQHLAQKAMRRHPLVLLSVATVAGAGIAYLLFRPRTIALQAEPARRQEPQKKQPGAVESSLKTLVKLTLPTLLKKAADTFLKEFLAKQQSAGVASEDSPAQGQPGEY